MGYQQPWRRILDGCTAFGYSMGFPEKYPQPIALVSLLCTLAATSCFHVGWLRLSAFKRAWYSGFWGFKATVAREYYSIPLPMSQTQTIVSTSVDIPRASLQVNSSAGHEPAQIELAELGRRESSKSVRISTGPSTPPSEPLSKSELWKGRIQFAALCWTLFLAGWNDGTTGPLLDRIQAVYHVITTVIHQPGLRTNYRCLQANYAVVSLIFVSNTVVSIWSTWM